MSSSFSDMLRVLEKLGDVSENPPLNKNGKTSKFKGVIQSKIEDKKVNLGILYYPWNRKIGVNKIHQALQFAENADLQGAVIIGSQFTTSAIEQTYRNNNSTDKRFLLMETEELNVMKDQLNTYD